MRGKDLIMSTLLGGGSSGGGGGGSAPAVSPKEVNFYDYDGTCVHAYTVAEAQALSELPAGPKHPGLVFQGWNWSLEGVKGLTRAMNIGAMYTTDDGTTRLYITLKEGRTSPMLGVGVNGTVTVDWGDGTEPDLLTGTNINTIQWTPNHAYAAPGDYVIRLTVDGEMAFKGSSSSNQYACILRYSTGGDRRNLVYQASLRKVEIGDGMTSMGSYAFYQCTNLECISIPRSVSTVNYFCNECYRLTHITIPYGETSAGFYLAQKCYGLTTVAMPNGVKTIGGYSFSSCYSLTDISIPEGVERIEDAAFSSCENLSSVILPASLLHIGSAAFTSCYGVAFYDFTACTAVPTLVATSAFSNIPADCEIRVPAALYDEWIAATNWATYASQIVAY